MNAYDAIMKAADHIERTPEDFDFGCGQVPRACGTPSCALGWIGHFLGRHGSLHSDIPCHLGVPTRERYDDVLEFYRRLTSLELSREVIWQEWSLGDWTRSHLVCARALRLYAEKYHSHEKPPAREDLRVVSWSDCAWLPNRASTPG